MKYEELAAAYRGHLSHPDSGWRECLAITAISAISTQLEAIAAGLERIAVLLEKQDRPTMTSRPPVQASIYPAKKPARDEELTDQSVQQAGTTFTRPKPRGPVVMPRVLPLDGRTL